MSDSIQFTKTSELDKRFSIGKNTRVNRLSMLGLTPDRLTKQGRFYLLNQEQLDLFIDFDKYILETGSSDGYPKLISARSDSPISSVPTEKHVESQVLEADKVVQVHDQIDSDSGQLTVTKQERESFIDLVPEQSDIFTDVTGEFTGTLPTYQADELLNHRVTANAQSRATAILIAEYTLAEQYISNPHLLDPELRAQLDDVQSVKIDPKKLAASLISAATVQRSMTAA